MGYQDLANSYSREADLGSQMQDQNNQRMVGATGSLFDRFQQAFLQRQQMQRQAKLDQQALEHEMWLRKRDEGIDQTNRDWHQAATQERVGKDIYNEYTGDPAQKALMSEALLRSGLAPDKVEAMFPKGTLLSAEPVKQPGNIGTSMDKGLMGIPMPNELGGIPTPSDLGVVEPGAIKPESNFGGGVQQVLAKARALAATEKLDRDQKAAAETGKEERAYAEGARRDKAQALLFGQQDAMAERRHQQAMAVLGAKNQGMDPNSLSPEMAAAVDALATQWDDSGQAPAGLARNKALQTLVVARLGAIRLAKGDGAQGLSKTFGDYKADLELKKSFEGNNKNARQVQSANTVALHFNTLKNAAQELKTSPFPAFNKIGQAFNIQMGDNAVTNYNAILNFLAGETDNLISGNNPSIAGTHHIRESFGSVGSPEQLMGAVAKAQEMVAGRVQSLNADYVRASKGKDLVSGGRLFGPAAENFKAVMSHSGGGFSVKAPNGKTYNFPDQASLDAFKLKAGIQ